MWIVRDPRRMLISPDPRNQGIQPHDIPMASDRGTRARALESGDHRIADRPSRRSLGRLIAPAEHDKQENGDQYQRDAQDSHGGSRKIGVTRWGMRVPKAVLTEKSPAVTVLTTGC